MDELPEAIRGHCAQLYDPVPPQHPTPFESFMELSRLPGSSAAECPTCQRSLFSGIVQ